MTSLPQAAVAEEPTSRMISWFVERHELLAGNIGRAVRGRPDVVRLALACLCCEGHLLIEDVPGVGKTSLARALAASIDGSWHRIQFTPDLLPSDVTGVTVYHQGRDQFEFRPGPVFANIVIGDEINRASPRTQSALLEVMDEQRVTIDGRTHPVPRPFMVIATQNPVDMDGTYRLPEAQLDRFLMRTSLGYPEHDAEVDILESQRRGPVVDQLTPVVTLEDVGRLVALASVVHVSPEVQDYIVRLAGALRASTELALAVSPRASLALMRAARAVAIADGRPFVTPEDVKAVAVAVLAHRLVLRPEVELAGRQVEAVVEEALRTVEVPRDLGAG